VPPEILSPRDLPTTGATGRQVPIGVDETTLSPVLLDFDTDPHIAVFGGTRCGKSNLLRLITKSIMDRHAPSDVRIVVLDYRRSLLDVSGPHTDHAATKAAAADLLREVRAVLTARLPSSGGARGPELFLVVDDYELVASSGDQLTPIAELLPWSRDIGLHVILARAMNGAGGAMDDPLIRQLSIDGGPALLMSGAKDEGKLFGDHRAEPLPPGRGRYVDFRGGTRMIQTARVDTM
jgi:DNA segregation ATPase FtsK/SpoIIIE, S-DNA-T family